MKHILENIQPIHGIIIGMPLSLLYNMIYDWWFYRAVKKVNVENLLPDITKKEKNITSINVEHLSLVHITAIIDYYKGKLWE